MDKSSTSVVKPHKGQAMTGTDKMSESLSKPEESIYEVKRQVQEVDKLRQTAIHKSRRGQGERAVKECKVPLHGGW